MQAAQQVLSETSDIGVGVMDTMTQQREVLLRATTKASNTTSLTVRARGIMRLMQARAITNKALLLLTVFVLLGVIGVVVWFGYLRPGSRYNPDPPPSPSSTPSSSPRPASSPASY